MSLLKQYISCIYQYGFFQCIKHKFSKKKDKLTGIGLGLFFVHGVHRVGTLWAFPTITSIRLLWYLRKHDKYSIVLSHLYGGGADAFIQRDLNVENYLLIVPTYVPGRLRCILFDKSKEKCYFYVASLKAIIHLKAKCHNIIINELVTWWKFNKEQKLCNDFYRIITEIIAIKNFLGCKLIFMLHDYFCICPKYTLTDVSNKYCDSEFSLKKCSKCLKYTEEIPVISGFDIIEWRNEFYRLLKVCNEIRAFSIDTIKRIEKCFPNLIITYKPHKYYPCYKHKPKITSDCLTIGVFGNISPIKGSQQVKDLIDYIHLKRIKNVNVVIVGNINNVFPNSGCKILGSYAVEDLPKIITDEKINFAFFSSVCPETFSYVISELIALELPIVCYNYGAQAERIREYIKGEIVQGYTPEETWLTIRKLSQKIGYIIE